MSCEIIGGQSGTGAGFPRVLRFPLPIVIPPNFSIVVITWGRYNRQIVADVPTGPSWTSPPTLLELNKTDVLKQF
jgi:hypothetical protein